MFYKESNFKETPIGKIPTDWEVIRLGTILSLKNGERPKISKTGSVPVYGANGVMGYAAEFSVDSDFTIIIGRVGASGEIHIGRGKIWVSDNAIYSESYDKSKTYLPFLYYLLKSKKLNHFASKTTHPIITQTFLRNFLIQSLKLPEQHKIAEILSTVDETIQKTNEIIAKTERLKKGLMQELLTKGIGHKEFKDTEIGRIPKDWEVVKLGDRGIAEIIMGQSPPSSTYNKDGKGLPFLQGKMEFGEIYPSPLLYCSQPIKIVEINDILISVRAPVGDVNVAPFKLCIGRGLAAIRFNPEKAIYWFYFYYLQKIKNFLEKLGKGSTFKAITKDDLEDLRVPYPSFSEQQKIAEILSTVDKKLKLERNEKTMLERIKQGMMDLLLTGKIRVKVD
ncbi:MAG: restriction endonuclease subunit S [Candidatus Bathyarchaeia archaeon]